GVGAADDQRDLVTGQRDVHRVGAVTVDDSGDLALGAQAAGEALAEAGADVGDDLVLIGHVVLLRTRGMGRAVVMGFGASDAHETRDHGAHITASITDGRTRTIPRRGTSPCYPKAR